MRIKDWTLPYFLLNSLFFLGAKGFYRKSRRTGMKNIPKNKPVFFVANHQNSLIDPIGITISQLQPSYSLGRSDVFKHPISGPILRSVNSLPIYRRRDGEDFMEKNEKIFDSCHEILNNNGRIMIFPEGSHNSKKRLRPLKSGVFTIIDGALEKYKDLDIYVVPVGLNYTNTLNKSSDFLVNFGKAIKISDFKEETGRERIISVMNAIDEGIREVIIDFSEEDYYDFYHYLCIDSKFLKSNLSLAEQFELRKTKTHGITGFIAKSKAKADEALEMVSRNTEYCTKNELKPFLFNKDSYSLIGDYLLLLLGFPFFLYGAINSFIPFVLPSFINKKMKDNQFHGPINLLGGTVFFLLFWLIQTSLVAIFTDNYIWLAYLVSLVVFGKFAYAYFIFWKKTMGKRRYNRLGKNDKGNIDEIKSNHLFLSKLFANF